MDFDCDGIATMSSIGLFGPTFLVCIVLEVTKSVTGKVGFRSGGVIR
jgi:hypothetical protein